MYKMMTIVALLTAAALVLVGCGGGGGADNTPGASAEYVPLSVGTQWRYDYHEYTNTAGLRSAKSLLLPRASLVGVKGKDLTAEDVVDITGTTEIGGSTWYSIVAHYVGGENEEPVYVRHNSQGFLRKDALAEAAYYMIRNPLTVGTTWVVTFVSGGLSYQETFKIVAVDQTIATPAGEFTGCLQIENVFQQAGEPDDVITYWYAPNVGQVKEERHVGQDLLYELQLTEYTPGVVS